MPVIKQAEKKLRRDKKQARINAAHRLKLRTAIKTMRSSPSKKHLETVFSLLDKTVKYHIVHNNKASRLKSRLSALLAKK